MIRAIAFGFVVYFVLLVIARPVAEEEKIRMWILITSAGLATVAGLWPW